jgi:hypothetical protein
MQWVVTIDDVRSKIELKADLETLHGYQMYQAIAEVASAVFGDKKKSTPIGTVADIPKNKEDAMQKFSALFG